jgi:hypothetical protein
VQPLFNHHKPSGDHRPLPGDDPYVGNLQPMPGVFPDYPAPVVRNAGTERELTLMRWGMPSPASWGNRQYDRYCPFPSLPSALARFDFGSGPLWRFALQRSHSGTGPHGNTQTFNSEAICADLSILQYRDGVVSIGSRCF